MSERRRFEFEVSLDGEWVYRLDTFTGEVTGREAKVGSVMRLGVDEEPQVEEEPEEHLDTKNLDVILAFREQRDRICGALGLSASSDIDDILGAINELKVAASHAADPPSRPDIAISVFGGMMLSQDGGPVEVATASYFDVVSIHGDHPSELFAIGAHGRKVKIGGGWRLGRLIPPPEEHKDD